MTSIETTDSKWKSLYKISGVVALSEVAFFIPISIIAFLIWPPPVNGTVIEWFTIFQENSFHGLVSFDLLYLITNIVLIPVTLALYIALRRTSASLMLIATVAVLVGTVALIAARPAFEMLSLSNQYAAATTDAQRAIFLAAGQATLAAFNGTAYHVHYILGSIALIIVSFVMLRSTVFSKKTAYIGIASNIIAFGLYVPEIGIYISAFSVVLYWIWYLLIARRFLKLGWS
jgi:hypothetical protein